MFQAGPLVRVNIPIDNATKKRKTFCFVQFMHEESVPYAIELFKDVRLFGRTLQMQNKTTGAGMSSNNYNRQNSHQQNQSQLHQRTMSAPALHLQQQQNFVPPFPNHPPRFDNQALMQQQRQMQQDNHYQRGQPPPYDRQFSDRSHDRGGYDRGHQDHYNQRDSGSNQRDFGGHGNNRRHHSHDRDDRQYHQRGHDQYHQGHDYRDRSHDRRNDSNYNRRR